MTATSTVFLEFSSAHHGLPGGKALRDGLSAVVQIGKSLWLANDETAALERLALVECAGHGGDRHAGDHVRFPLGDYLSLPMPPEDGEDAEEADVEGLACEDGYLWLVGSHSLKRKKPKLRNEPEKARKQLAQLQRDGNRFLLGRIPLVDEGGTPCLAKEARQHGGKRSAARLEGDADSNALFEALHKDEHLQPFLAIPGKDNGFDIEGLAVAGERLFLGLRGPVLRGWAVILEIAVEKDAGQPEMLKLKSIGPEGRPYLKHFLQLDGLGIRDLCRDGADLLILAGPSMDLDGPVRVYRWPEATGTKGEQVVPRDELARVLDVPYGEGSDHPEGMALFSPAGGAADSLVIVYDSASKARQFGESSVAADVFLLDKGPA